MMLKNTQGKYNLWLPPSFVVFLHKDSDTTLDSYRIQPTVGPLGTHMCQLGTLTAGHAVAVYSVYFLSTAGTVGQVSQPPPLAAVGYA